MDSQPNQPFSMNSFVLELLPKRLPGKVTKKWGPLMIEPLISTLPLDDGTYAGIFFAPHGGAEENDYVLFRWEKVGKRGFDFSKNKPGDPTALEVEVVPESRANEIAEEIRRLISEELRENLKKERINIKTRENKIDELVQQQVQARLVEVEQRDYELNQRDYELDQREHHIDDTLRQHQEAINRDRADIEAQAVSIRREQTEFSQQLRAIAPYQQAIPDIIPTEATGPTAHSPLPQNLARRWQDSLSNNGLVLPEALSISYLISLLSAFYAGSLVLLNGPVGVGKTSIVKESANITNGQAKIIPVRPAWLDPTDLLGYFDPIKEVFRPSSFLNALNDAKTEPDKLCLVCLDELNLARIENYGADLLSSLEYSSPSAALSQTQPEQQGLLLYSESIEQDLWQQARSLHEEIDKIAEDSQRLHRIDTMLRNYPANFQLSANTTILGTLNSDETTYDLSPKIIDRSYVVTYPAADLTSQLPTQSPALTQTLNLSTAALIEAIQEKLKPKSNLEAAYEEYQVVPILEGVDRGWQSMAKWIPLLAGLCIPLGYRTKRDFRTLYAVCEVLGLSHQDCLGHFLFLKVFPRVSFLKNADTQSRFSQCLETMRNDFKVMETELEHYDPGEILAQLEKQVGDRSRQYVRYWVRV